VKSARWFGQGVIERRKFRKDKNPVDPVYLGFCDETRVGHSSVWGRASL